MHTTFLGTTGTHQMNRYIRMYRFISYCHAYSFVQSYVHTVEHVWAVRRSVSLLHLEQSRHLIFVRPLIRLLHFHRLMPVAAAAAVAVAAAAAANADDLL
jgi:hypothetical protein